MSKTIDTESFELSNTTITKPVTALFGNTHCIVCGKRFQVPRTSKLYCSTRCKQFGYNHKTQISQILEHRDRAINPKELTFLIDDYVKFNKKQRLLRSYHDLEKKRRQWEGVDQELRFRQKLELPISSHMLDSYATKRLTENEESDLYDAETELEDRIMVLVPKELSLEQWSFIKSLYPLLGDLSFFEIVCSLSRDFFNELSLDVNSDGDSEYIVIKNKYINHCNLIASGIIKFQDMPEEI